MIKQLSLAIRLFLISISSAQVLGLGSPLPLRGFKKAKCDEKYEVCQYQERRGVVSCFRVENVVCPTKWLLVSLFWGKVPV